MTGIITTRSNRLTILPMAPYVTPVIPPFAEDFPSGDWVTDTNTDLERVIQWNGDNGSQLVSPSLIQGLPMVDWEGVERASQMIEGEHVQGVLAAPLNTAQCMVWGVLETTKPVTEIRYISFHDGDPSMDAYYLRIWWNGMDVACSYGNGVDTVETIVGSDVLPVEDIETPQVWMFYSDGVTRTFRIGDTVIGTSTENLSATAGRLLVGRVTT